MLFRSGVYQDVWQLAGTSSADLLHGHVVGSVGTLVYVSGFFQGMANFPIGGSKTSAGGLDLFLMALDTAPPLARALATTSTGAGSADSISVESRSVDDALSSLHYDYLDDLVVTFKRKKGT